MRHSFNSMILAIVLAAGNANAQGVQRLRDGVLLRSGDAWLKVAVVSDDIFRVAYARDQTFFDRKNLDISLNRLVEPHWDLATDASGATISTSRVKARIDAATGAISFLDSSGQTILAELPGGHSLEAANVQGVQTFHVREQWLPNADESLYGLGQQQLGLMDIKGYDLDLWQHNGTVVIPFLVSSRGYGILWDNLSYSRFGDPQDFAAIPAAQLVDLHGQAGGLTVGTFTSSDSSTQNPHSSSDIGIGPNGGRPGGVGRNLRNNYRWAGYVMPAVTGDYQFQTFSNGGIKVWIDNRLVINHWRQDWLPWYDRARVHLEAKRPYAIKMEFTCDQGSQVRLTWKPPADNPPTSLWSEVGDGINYYFVYGPELDHVISGYRHLTGQATMIPIWALGLWQSRQRYETAQQSLDVVQGFRSRGIPFDNIVQDWQYWKRDAWGSHQFDPERFPDPAGWIKAIHDLHARLMISVWGKFYTGTDNFKAMQAAGFLYPRNLQEGLRDWIGFPYTFFDAFNPDARKLFWQQIKENLFSKGVDAWWADATEPDLLPTPTLEGQRTHVNPTALGPGSRVLNGYALMTSEALYDGQRAASPNQRVFILTRSGFAGQQRYGAATWSGDTSSTWTAMRKQIDAGLGFCVSGVPYWTMDAGGFSVPGRFASRYPTAADFEEWCELNTRWFEFATFCPLLRSHGEYPFREMWQYGGDKSPAYQAQLKFDRLRYALLPYLYSLAGSVTQDDYTLMRPLVMDFRADARSHRVGDEYMFGPAFLVSPVTEYQSRSRPVYLPPSAGWYDFWSGAAWDGGQTLVAAAPYDAIPIFVRAGSIIPLGPPLQYTTEKPADPITLLVYAGADADFTLYEDEGTNYNYEHGAFAQIPIHWNDASKTLMIGKRQGSFDGMLADRTFNIVLVSKSKPVGFPLTIAPDRTVQFSGAPWVASLGGDNQK
jgi:alpha-D-xyloside xylohydrolase